MLWLLALLCGLPAISVDVFFPAVTVVRDYFDTSAGLVQGSVYGFFIGLGVAQLLWGNLSDYLGRRPVMLCGGLLFCGALVGCLLSNGIEWFIFFRFLQGIGAAVGTILARAIVRDIYGMENASKAFATMFLIFSLMPIVLPPVGGFIITHYHWHSVLYLMLAAGALLMTTVYLILMETAPLLPEERQHHSVNPILRCLLDYQHVVINAGFIKYAATNMLAFTALLVFVSNSSVILSRTYGLTPAGIGYFLMCFGACLASGVLLIRFFLVARIGVTNTIRMANVGLVVACVVVMVLVLTDNRSWFTVMCAAIWLFAASIGALLTLCAGEAIKPFSQRAGTASSLYGFIQHCGASLLGFALSVFSGGQLTKVALGLLPIAVAALVVQQIKHENHE